MRLPALLLIAATLAACSVLPKRDPMQIYAPVSSASAADAASWPQASWSLLIAEPAASQAVDSERIAVRPDAGTLQVYKGASWSDPAPELVQSALLRRFEDSGKILSVSRPGTGVQGQYQLLSDLRSFDAIYGNGPEAVIEIQAKLVDARDGHVIASRNFTEREPAAGEDIALVVQAFSRALDRTTGAIAAWALAEGNRHEAKHAGEGHGDKH